MDPGFSTDKSKFLAYMYYKTKGGLFGDHPGGLDVFKSILNNNVQRIVMRAVSP